MVANINAIIWLHKYFVKKSFVSGKWMEVFDSFRVRDNNRSIKQELISTDGSSNTDKPFYEEFRLLIIAHDNETNRKKIYF